MELGVSIVLKFQSPPLFNSVRIRTLSADQEQVVLELKEQNQRLQVQVNNGYTGFEDFKKRKNAEIEVFQNQVEQLTEQVKRESMKIKSIRKSHQNLKYPITIMYWKVFLKHI